MATYKNNRYKKDKHELDLLPPKQTVKHNPKSNKWTPKEDEILRKHMIRHSNNFTQAFEEASHELPGRGARAIAGRYYHVLKNDPNFRIMAVLTPDGRGAYNTKNINRKPLTVMEDPDNELVSTIGYLATKLKAGQRKDLIEMLFRNV